MAVNVLPESIRLALVNDYVRVREYIEQNPCNNFDTIATGRDVSKLDVQLIAECNAIISLLKQPAPDNIGPLQTALAKHLIMWDKEFNLNAYDFYPEYREFFKQIGYAL